MNYRRFAVYAAAGGFAIVALLVITGLTEDMTDGAFWFVVGMGIALAGTLIVAGPKEGKQ